MPGPNARYTPLAASREDEMEAAFESDDEDTTDASRPMLPQSRAAAPGAGSPTTPSHARSPSTTTPGGYNFEQVYDYDWARPPPGSPPRPSATALPNDIGNTNGELPTAGQVWRPNENPTFLQRTLRSLFPARYARVATTEAGSRPMGGGSGNDGVFANVTAKPTAARVERTPEGVYVMPEEAQKDTPPSYTAAQADAVPPYWETTVHAPSASVVGEMVVDGLATGTLFSFLWNMLISLSFNFVGFLLTYLLHTTHAAKYGSRAGLGITMLQYGFALRNREPGSSDDYWPGMDVPEPTPANERSMNANETLIAITQAIATPTAAAPADDTMQDGSLPYPHEWIAFFLMTIGWFLVLTSFLGYWRVKRWEYQILSANRSTAAASASPAVPTVSPAEQLARDRAVRRNLEQLFGFSAAARRDSSDPVMISAARRRERERDLEAGHGAEPDDDDEASLTPEERRLREDLRAAGLI